jgi:hypothetical protein
VECDEREGVRTWAHGEDAVDHLDPALLLGLQRRRDAEVAAARFSRDDDLTVSVQVAFIGVRPLQPTVAVVQARRKRMGAVSAAAIAKVDTDDDESSLGLRERWAKGNQAS